MRARWVRWYRLASVTARYVCGCGWIVWVWCGLIVRSYEVNVNRHSAPWAAVSLTFNSDRDKNPSVGRLIIQASRDDSAALYFAVAISRDESGRSPPSLCGGYIQWQDSEQGSSRCKAACSSRLISAAPQSHPQWINVPYTELRVH